MGSSTSGYSFDEREADKALAFFEKYCRHAKGELAGQPFRLEPWQAERIIRPLFGWKRDSDGTRRYRKLFVAVPRKNGKSTLMAGLGLKLIFADGEKGAEVYSAAADRDQAAIIFDCANSMVQASGPLSARAKSFRRAIRSHNFGVFKVLSSVAGTKHGLNPHGVLVDELHVHKTPDLVEALETGRGARRQPLICKITTAGFDKKTPCWKEWAYATSVESGLFDDPAYLSVIYSAPDGADFRDRDVWRAANPNLGVSKKLEYMEEECRVAESSPGKENVFRRLELNQWTEQSVRWITGDVWKAAETTLSWGELAKLPCWGGLDLSSTRDLSAFALCWKIGEKYALRVWLWCPGATAKQRQDADKVPYVDWIRDQWIQGTEGNAVDFDRMRAGINEICKGYDVREVAYDPWNALQLALQLQGDGFVVKEHRQGFASMAAPTQAFERALLDRRLWIEYSPVLRWQAGNIAVRQDPAGNLKPDKERSGDRIDGIVAAIMALGRAAVAPPPSVYNERGLFVLG